MQTPTAPQEGATENPANPEDVQNLNLLARFHLVGTRGGISFPNTAGETVTIGLNVNSGERVAYDTGGFKPGAIHLTSGSDGRVLGGNFIPAVFPRSLYDESRRHLESLTAQDAPDDLEGLATLPQLVATYTAAREEYTRVQKDVNEARDHYTIALRTAQQSGTTMPVKPAGSVSNEVYGRVDQARDQLVAPLAAILEKKLSTLPAVKAVLLKAFGGVSPALVEVLEASYGKATHFTNLVRVAQYREVAVATGPQDEFVDRDKNALWVKEAYDALVGGVKSELARNPGHKAGVEAQIRAAFGDGYRNLAREAVDHLHNPPAMTWENPAAHRLALSTNPQERMLDRILKDTGLSSEGVAAEA